MKKIFNSSKKNHWFKASVTFLTCLLFLAVPSCQKDQLEPDSLLNPDNKTAPASAASSSAKMYWASKRMELRNLSEDRDM